MAGKGKENGNRGVLPEYMGTIIYANPFLPSWLSRGKVVGSYGTVGIIKYGATPQDH